MHSHIEKLFDQVGCDGQLCVQPLDGSGEFALHADRQVVAASVIKVLIALEAETRFADGRLDPRERVVLRAGARTLGPTGFSLYDDDVEVSLRDMVVAMLTISDNPVTDALLDRVGINGANATAARLGLTGTAVAADLRTSIDSLGQGAGFAGWAEMTAWSQGPHSPEEMRRAVRGMRSSAALTPELANRTTPRDMVTLLRLIWSDQAGPAPACERVRRIMARQLTRHRLASGFRPPARVAAKSGSLVGVVRGEVGVIQYPDGRGYAAAVFTRARLRQPGEYGHNEARMSAVIGTTAAAAVDALTGEAT